MSGYFVGFADNLGDELIFKILKNYLITVLHRSVVSSESGDSHRNKRVSFRSDVKDSLKSSDNKPSLSFFGKVVTISINLERLIMMCQKERGLRKITKTSILA
jgi:hypothetical protein